MTEHTQRRNCCAGRSAALRQTPPPLAPPPPPASLSSRSQPALRSPGTSCTTPALAQAQSQGQAFSKRSLHGKNLGSVSKHTQRPPAGVAGPGARGEDDP